METPRSARRIVVGVDGSPSSVHALEWAIDEAGRGGGTIDAVLVCDTGLAWIDVGSDAEAMIVEHSKERAEKTLQEALAAVTVSLDAHTTIDSHVIPGDPIDVLVKAAAGADLLVVGSRGRGGFTGLLLGSVSQRCAERSRCPVVIVPPWSAHAQEGGRS